jgi:hypothetical protein
LFHLAVQLLAQVLQFLLFLMVDLVILVYFRQKEFGLPPGNITFQAGNGKFQVVNPALLKPFLPFRFLFLLI